MPFLTAANSDWQQTQFYVLHETAPHLGINITQKMAQCFIKQKKKVLIFDALLGLKNFPAPNKNPNIISLIFKHHAPLSELIFRDKGIDIIAGISHQNLTALSQTEQQSIKNSLKQLALNYDIVLIEIPLHVVNSIWDDLGENLWIVSQDKNLIRKTLSNCTQEAQPNLRFHQNFTTRLSNHSFLT